MTQLTNFGLHLAGLPHLLFLNNIRNTKKKHVEVIKCISIFIVMS